MTYTNIFFLLRIHGSCIFHHNFIFHFPLFYFLLFFPDANQLIFSSLIRINSLRFSNAMCINSLYSSNAMRILSFFSSCILLFSSLISFNWEESIETTSSQFFFFFNFSFSTFLPMGLSKVSQEFILSLSSSKFIEVAKV